MSRIWTFKSVNTFRGCEMKIKIWAVYFVRFMVVQFSFLFEHKKPPIYRTDFWFNFLNVHFQLILYCTKKKNWTKKRHCQFWVYFWIIQQSKRSFFTFWLGEIILNRFNRCLIFVQVKPFRFLNRSFLSSYLCGRVYQYLNSEQNKTLY